MRSFIPVTLAGLCLVSLSGCMDYSDPNRTNMSRNGPMTTDLAIQCLPTVATKSATASTGPVPGLPA